MADPVEPQLPRRLALDVTTIRMIVQVMAYFGERQTTLENRMAQVEARFNNLNGAFTTLVDAMQKQQQSK